MPASFSVPCRRSEDYFADNGMPSISSTTAPSRDATGQPRRDGPSELVLTPLELIDKIARLVARTHRHRYYDVLALNPPLRATVTALAPAVVIDPSLPDEPRRTTRCEPSRNGLSCDWPHRQSRVFGHAVGGAAGAGTDSRLPLTSRGPLRTGVTSSTPLRPPTTPTAALPLPRPPPRSPGTNTGAIAKGLVPRLGRSGTKSRADRHPCRRFAAVH